MVGCSCGGCGEFTVTVCDRCGYEWEYSGGLSTTTCPNCNRKTSTENLNAEDVTLSPVGGIGECWMCGSSEEIHYHHVSYEEDVVVPLCRDHHDEVHGDEEHPLHPVDERPPSGRDNRIRVSDGEKKTLEEAMELWYDVPEEIPFGKAIGDFSDFIIRDQGPPPEEVDNV